MTGTDLTAGRMLALKGKRRFTEVNVQSVEHAAAAEAAGIDMVVSGNLPLRPALRAAAPGRHFCFGLRYGQAVEPVDALRQAFAALEDGADSIYCPSRMEIVEALAVEGVPVVGHAGLMPQKARWTGFRAIGRSAEEAWAVWQKVKDYESAGAFAVELEVVPTALGAEITRSTPMLVISMGSGAACDVEYLFATDILGETEGHIPRHARVYRDFAGEYRRLAAERAAAFAEFRRDVETGAYPAPEHLVEMPADEWDRFRQRLDAARDGAR